MRFYLDEDLSQKIAAVARRLGIDITSSHELGHDRLTDDEQLSFATGEGRCLVGANRDDYIRLTNRWFAEQRVHAGVLIVPSTWHTNDYARIARALAAYAEHYGEGSTDFLFDFLR